MRISDFYRGLLRLYPADFHNEFSEEMHGVFEQKAAEHFASGGAASIAFVVKEFISIAKGGYMMRMARTFAIYRDRFQRNNSQPTTVALTQTPLTIAEATKQRDTAIKNMVTAIAEHDFPKARQYSYEEIRFKNLLKDLQNEVTTGHRGTA